MHPEILDGRRLQCLHTLLSLPELEPFYLAGGTALSLQLGLRQSMDFDFFTAQRFNADAVFASISGRFEECRLIHLDRDTCDLVADGIQLSFMRYPYPMLNALVTGEGDFDRLRMAGTDDIAAMKLSAIGSGGSRKDFFIEEQARLFDLYEQMYRNPS